MKPQPDASALNIAMERFYSTILEDWKRLRVEQAENGHCLSIPLFLKISSAYLEAHPKIVFVGQETHGWWTDHKGDPNALRASEIMDFYEEEWIELYHTYRRSSYWQAMRYIAESLQLVEPPRSFLYSNIFPCDVDKKRAPLALHPTLREWLILPEEIEILKPDYVIFFCGPEYYGNLKTYFGAWPVDSISKQDPLIFYQPPGRTWKGWVTYHPASLRRFRKGKYVLEKIVRLIKNDLNSKCNPTKTDIFQ